MKLFKRITAFAIAIMMCFSMLCIISAEEADASRMQEDNVDNAKKIENLLDFSSKLNEMKQKYMPKTLERNSDDPYSNARIIVKSAEQLDYTGALSAVNGYNDWHVIQYATPEEAEKACAYYLKLDSVEYAHPDRVLNVAADPGSNEFLSYGYDEDHSNAFDYNEWLLEVYGGLENIPELIVGVIDTGVDYYHPMLEDRVVDGYNFVGDNDDPYDDHYHGTHMAGIIVDGTLSNVKIMPLKACTSSGSSDEIWLGLAMEYAHLNGCGIVNVSIYGRGKSDYLEEITNEGTDNGTVYCFCAGNSGADASGYFPANIQRGFTVASCNINDVLAETSNYGDAVDITANGVDIYSSVPGGLYEEHSGTSMATPHAAAAIAMVKSFNPEIDAETAMNIVMRSAEDVRDIRYGGGILRINNMLRFDAVLNVDYLNLHFNSDGANSWQVTEDYAFSGNSGANNTTSTLISNIELKGYQELVFSYNVSGEQNDIFKFYADDELVFEASGESGWTTYTYQPANTREIEFKWVYEKDGSFSSGDDMVKLREIYVQNTISSTINTYGIDQLFETDTAYPWTIDGGTVKSGNTGVNNSTSSLSTTVSIIAGIDITFQYRVSGGSGDKLTFSINGETVLEEASTSGWREYTFETDEAGVYELIWTYTKDASGASGDDCAWIRRFDIDHTLSSALNCPNGTLEFVSAGSTGWFVENGYAKSRIRGLNDFSSTITLRTYMEEGDMLSFEYMVDSEHNFDNLYFIVNDVIKLTSSGEIHWTNYVFTAPSSGDYEFEWVYYKDSDYSEGDDSACIDNVALISGSFTLGDVNDDQNVNAVDALLILRYALDGSFEGQFNVLAADFDENSLVNAIDALLVLRHALN